MKKICIFCGSSPGKEEKYMALGKRVGNELAAAGFGLVYGGASIGVMGAAADGTMEEGGEVVGVIPESLKIKEVVHNGLDELVTTKNMHERKQLMYDLSEAFVVLPGGFGTMDEFFEILTWAQLGYHSKPIYLLNEGSFFTPLVEFIGHLNQSGFVRQQHLDLFKVFESFEQILEDIK